MPMSKAERLVALGVPTQQAQEFQKQIENEAARLPTTTQRGGILTQGPMANIGAAPTQGDFNNLLATLRNAGVIAR